MSYVNGMNYYRNVTPVAFQSEAWAPVPGWGMHPNQAGPRRIAVGGLGKVWTGTVNTPIGKQTITIDLPIEQMAKDAGNEALKAVWPTVQKTLEGEVPKLLSQNMPKVLAMLKPTIEEELGKVRTTAFIVTGVLVAGMLGAAYWIKKE